MKWFNGIIIYQMIGLLIRWFEKANEDGKITVEECVNLLLEAGRLMGLTIPHEILRLTDTAGSGDKEEKKDGIGTYNGEHKPDKLKPADT